MEARFGVLYEGPQFLVSVCLIIGYGLATQLGTESAKKQLKRTRKEAIMDPEMKLEAEVKQVIAQALELEIEPEKIPDDELLLGAGMGADSIVMLQLVMALETHFAIDVEDEELRAEWITSARSIAEFVRGKIPAVGV